MRRVLIIALFALIFIAGLSILLYPTVSDYINSLSQTRAVEEYFSVVKNLSERDYTELIEAARKYNEDLPRKPSRFTMTQEEDAEYRILLNPTGFGAIGTLEIDVIDIHLPIYHGTDESVLQIGLGHLEGTSLPIGGPGTHAVVTGHRGLPSSTLLTNLDRMEIGDTFRINVLNETLVYKVDQKVIVEPREMAELAIVAGAAYCTLVTCTPYGINRHRMLVRGKRVAGDGTGLAGRLEFIPSGARVLTGARAALLLIAPTATTATIILFIRLRRIYGRGKRQ